MTGSDVGVLKQVTVSVIGRDTCNRGDWYSNRITPRMLCAGSMQTKVHGCQVTKTNKVKLISGRYVRLVCVDDWNNIFNLPFASYLFYLQVK